MEVKKIWVKIGRNLILKWIWREILNPVALVPKHRVSVCMSQWEGRSIRNSLSTLIY